LLKPASDGLVDSRKVGGCVCLSLLVVCH
jgi:hypothetical protein